MDAMFTTSASMGTRLAGQVFEVHPVITLLDKDGECVEDGDDSTLQVEL